MMKSLAVLGGTVAATLALTGAAQAATGYERLGAFNEAAADGQAAHQHRIAVNQVSGDVYTTDVTDDRIEVSKPGAGTATALTNFGAGVVTDPYGIAIDQSNGDVYVSDDDDVVKFTSDGAATPTFTKDNTFASPGVTGPLAFDQGSNQLLVADRATNTVRRYNANGSVPATDATFDGSAGANSPGAFTGLQDLAVDSDGDVIVVDATGNPARNDGSVSRVERFSANGEWEATIGPVEQAATVAVRPVNDDVLISGNQNAVYVDGSPTVRAFSKTGARLTRLSIDAAYATVSGIAADDGADGQVYVATDNGDYNGTYSYGPTSVQVFGTFVIVAPELSGLSAQPDQHRVRLEGSVDPNRDTTTWAFEYGKTAAYGMQEPADPQEISGGDTPVTVAGKVRSLEAGTTYHYRLKATNVAGTTYSTDRTFVTQPPAPAGTGHAPERAYELVSPADKAGNAVDTASTVQTSPDGNAVAFSIPGAVPGAPTSVLSGYYMARRGADWSTASLDLPQGNALTPAMVGPTLFVSPDLSRSFQYSQRALAPGAIEGGGNLYSRDNLSGALKLVAAVPGKQFDQLAVFAHGPGAAASDDFSRAVFTSEAALTPDAVAGVSNFYEWRNGQLSLAAVLPDGTVDAAGGANGTISRDGSRIIFSAAATGAMYLRTGTTTVPISVSQRPGDPDTPQPAIYVGSSSDGSIVYFTSRGLLTPDAGSGSTLPQLFKYDATDGELTLVSKPNDPSGTKGDVQGVTAVSADGAYVYFTSRYDYTGTAVAGEYNFYVAHDGVVRFIGSLGPNVVGSPWGSSVSPSGRFVAFTTAEKLTPADTTGSKCPSDVAFSQPEGDCMEAYRYDALTGVLECLSCAPVDGENAFSDFGLQSPRLSGRAGQAMLDDGRVVFNSYARLVPQDVNGQRDVYEWKDGVVSLVSSGKSAEESTFADTSSDGRDVFFFTSERLVKRDTDAATDLYDARVDGGIAAQDVASKVDVPCVSDACQGAPLGGPGSSPSVGSVDFSGPADSLPAPRATVGRKATVSASRKVVRGSSFSITVKTPAAGTVKVSGSGLIPVSRKLAKAGTAKVAVRLSKRAKATLKRRRSLRVKARVTYTQAGKPASTTTVSVTLKA